MDKEMFFEFEIGLILNISEADLSDETNRT